MTDKERLVELIIQSADYAVDACNGYASCAECPYGGLDRGYCHANFRADHLIANSVVVQKQGEWIVHQDNDGTWHFDCPFCDDGYAIKTNHAERFCSNCGALLVKEDK